MPFAMSRSSGGQYCNHVGHVRTLHAPYSGKRCVAPSGVSLMDRRGTCSVRSAVTSRAWHGLSEPLVWQGTEAEALETDSLPQQLSAPWKVILLSDGSVTRHLQLMTGLRVQVDCLQMKDLEGVQQDLLEAAACIQGPLLQREVFLRRPQSRDSCAGLPLVYATSWWNSEQARLRLKDSSKPIWTSLQGTELRRDLQNVYCGHSSYLEEKFASKGPFWARDYIFFADGGRPLTLIYEVFSTSLEQYLGPLRGT